jgi:hypothetical protein
MNPYKMTYDVISIMNKVPEAWYYLFDEYIKSLGEYKPKIFKPTYWGGLGTKPKVLHQLIKDKTINCSHIIFTDAWDFLFCAHPDEIMEAYGWFNSPLVISTEANCFPADLKEDFDNLKPTTKYKYLNSGFICGEVEALLYLLEKMDLPNMPDDHYDPVKNCNVHPNDQFEYQKLAIKYPELVALDYKQILSQTLHGATIDEFDFSKDRIKNKITGSYPCTLHFNGGSKDDMAIREPILKHLKLV